MKFRPRGDRIHVRAFELKGEVSGGGIVIPDTAEDKKPMFGLVIAVGEGRYEPGSTAPTPLLTRPGTIVMLNRHAGIEFRIADEQHRTIRESEVLGEVDDFPPHLLPPKTELTLPAPPG